MHVDEDRVHNRTFARALRDALHKKKLRQCVSRFNTREEALRRRGAPAPCSPAFTDVGSAARHSALARVTCTRALARKVVAVLPSTLARGADGDRGVYYGGLGAGVVTGIVE